MWQNWDNETISYVIIWIQVTWLIPAVNLRGYARQMIEYTYTEWVQFSQYKCKSGHAQVNYHWGRLLVRSQISLHWRGCHHSPFPEPHWKTQDLGGCQCIMLSLNYVCMWECFIVFLTFCAYIRKHVERQRRTICLSTCSILCLIQFLNWCLIISIYKLGGRLLVKLFSILEWD